MNEDKESPELVVTRVDGARGDLYDTKGNLVAKDVEIAPYIVVDITIPSEKK